jgi:hypothetical protein
VSTDSRDNEELMPEEILEGLNPNSREIFSGEELAEFLDEWADKESFVNDLSYVADKAALDNVPPEKVFEYLASETSSYSLDQMIEMAEEWSGQEWENYPEVSKTGEIRQPLWNEVMKVPRQEGFIHLSGGYKGETQFSDGDKDVILQEHESGWMFDGKVYGIESNFDDVFFEAQKLPGEDSYRAVVFSRHGHKYPLEACRDVFSEDLVKGLRTHLALQE